jgi:hypothetical protein
VHGRRVQRWCEFPRFAEHQPFDDVVVTPEACRACEVPRLAERAGGCRAASTRSFHGFTRSFSFSETSEKQSCAGFAVDPVNPADPSRLTSPDVSYELNI